MTGNGNHSTYKNGEKGQNNRKKCGENNVINAPSPRKISIFIGGINLPFPVDWVGHGIVLPTSGQKMAGLGRCGHDHSSTALVAKAEELEKKINMGVSENSVPLNPMVNDHYPY